MQINDKTVASNLFWRIAERFGAQGVTLIISIILARLLNPEVYGTIALITIFITILQVFLESGFSNALIQKKDADDLDFSSVFYFNIVFSIILYFILFFLAPLIAKLYKMPELTALIRVLGLTLIIFSVKSVQQAYVSRNMMFKKFFFSTLWGTIGAAIGGILLAYLGYGVWALVVQHLFNMLIDTITLWFIVKWRPKLSFSFSRLKLLLSYGWKLLASSLLDTIYNEIRQLIIGVKYTSIDLAYYNQGQKYSQVIVTNINSSIDSVLFPTMSFVQNDHLIIKKITKRAIKISTFIMMPMMMGIAVCAKPLVELILTDKWLPCIPYMRIFCFTFAFYPVHTANLNSIKSIGRSDLFLKLEVTKKIIGTIVLLSTMWWGPLIMAYSLIFTCIICQIVNSWPNRKLLNYGYLEQLKDMMPQIILTCFMGFAVYFITFFNLSNWLTLLIQILLGIIIYIGGAGLFKMESFTYCLNIVKSYFCKNKKVESNEKN